ncbi:d-aminoacylase [Fusarium napiforme]|uniref:D-aminoacylase n=1 Tax=Fusarium napiforme TaxID=42672 RepID=A0A8H5JND0_9HYPO|nr:d-aminoacylase [Fusarium napiforme]
MADITVRLYCMSQHIERFMAIAGTPGVSIGVMTKENPIFFDNHGFRNVEKKLLITEDTIFPIRSLAKAITAAGIGNILLGSEDVMEHVNNRPLVRPFRSQFGYNNLHYELAGFVIEQVSGQSYFDFMQSRLLDPLGMERTSFQTPPKSVDNVTVCYNALENASIVPIDFLKIGDGGYGAASCGARSPVKDLVKLYSSFVKGFVSQFSGSTTLDDAPPLKQLNHIMSAKIPFDQPSQHEAFYTFGWGKVQLPRRFGQIGLNRALLPQGIPIIGRGTSSLVLFHQGILPGLLIFVALLPETETVIVVLTNSLALNDAADWMGQLIIEDIVNVPSKLRTDFVRVAEATVAENLKWYLRVVDELEKGRKAGTLPKPFAEYVGTYWHDLHKFKIDVKLVGDKLYWLMQGLETQNKRLELAHYHDDTFTWLQSRGELASRGRWVGSDQGATFWKVKFEASESANINKLSGVPDRSMEA